MNVNVVMTGFGSRVSVCREKEPACCDKFQVMCSTTFLAVHLETTHHRRPVRRSVMEYAPKMKSAADCRLVRRF